MKPGNLTFGFKITLLSHLTLNFFVVVVVLFPLMARNTIFPVLLKKFIFEDELLKFVLNCSQQMCPVLLPKKIERKGGIEREMGESESV